jgi:hypothetical protein
MTHQHTDFEGKSLFYKVIVGLWSAGLIMLGALWAFLTRKRG